MNLLDVARRALADAAGGEPAPEAAQAEHARPNASLAVDDGRTHGDLADEMRATIRAHKPAIVAELQTSHAATFYRWRIAIPGRDPFEVRVLPESTADEMRAHYPGATVEPIPD